MSKVLIDREAVEKVIEKAESTIRHFNIERIGESTYKDTNTRCELHEAVNKLRAALDQEVTDPVEWQCRFKDELQWHWCSEEHFKMVLGNPGEWPGYEVRQLYAETQPAQNPHDVPMLTDDEIEREWQFAHGEDGSRPTHHDFAGAIEQLVRQKAGLVGSSPQPAQPGGYTA